MSIQTINPATEEPLQVYEELSSAEVERKIEQAHKSFLNWRQISFQARAEKIIRLSQQLLTDKQSYAQLISLEMGKPIQAALAEVEKSALACEFFAQQAEEYLKPVTIASSFPKSYIRYQPLGSILLITPWNYPFWQVFRSAIPLLMAGNTCLLKHAPNTTGCGLAIESAFKKAGFDEGIFQSLICDIPLIEVIISHPLIQGVSFTGSVAAGKSVASLAGRHLKKAVLELGGNDAYLVLADADLTQAAESCVRSRLNNSGQVCIAAKRLIILKSQFKKFEQEVIRLVARYQMGNPLDEKTQLGPLARKDIQQTVHQQVQTCLAQGAIKLQGGEIPKEVGYFYPATILKNIQPQMLAYREEIFGPVIALCEAETEAEAIELANDTPYGLSAAIFTQDIPHAEQIATQLEVGVCAINTLVSSDPHLPFGGIKCSGIGRELGFIGIREFTNIKTIYTRCI